MTRVTSAFGRAFSVGRYDWSSSSAALSDAESAGPPDASAAYLQRHSRATLSKVMLAPVRQWSMAYLIAQRDVPSHK